MQSLASHCRTDPQETFFVEWNGELKAWFGYIWRSQKLYEAQIYWLALGYIFGFFMCSIYIIINIELTCATQIKLVWAICLDLSVLNQLMCVVICKGFTIQVNHSGLYTCLSYLYLSLHLRLDVFLRQKVFLAPSNIFLAAFEVFCLHLKMDQLVCIFYLFFVND